MKTGQGEGLSIFSRLLIAFFGLLFVTIGILIFVFYSFSRKYLERLISDDISRNIVEIGQGFDDHLKNELVKDLNLLASNPKLDDLITNPEPGKFVIVPSVERLFLDFLNFNESYTSISFVNAVGKELVAVNRSGRLRRYRDIGKTAFFREIESGPAGGIHLTSIPGGNKPWFTAGIFKTDQDIGKFGGAVLIDYDLADFFNYVEARTFFGRDSIWIFSPGGEVLKRPGGVPGFDPTPFLSRDFQGTPRLISMERGILLYQDLCVVPGKPLLRLAVAIPSSVLMKNIRRDLTFSGIVFLAASLVAFLFALSISRYLSKPVVELAAATRRIASGKPSSARVDIRAGGEMKMLVESFNQMASDLQKTTVTRDFMNNIIHSIADSLVVLNPDMTIQTVNTATERVLGYSSAELSGLHCEALFSEVGYDPERFRELRETGLIKDLETFFRTKDGRNIPMLMSAAVLKDPDGAMTGIVLVGKDISALKKVEEELRQANERANAILRASPEPIMIVTIDGEIALWNEAAERTFGWKEEEVLGKLNPIVSEENLSEFGVNMSRVLSGKGFSGEEAGWRRKDGSVVYVSISAAPLHDAEGKPSGVVAIVSDITGRKRMEEELFKTEKLESLGVLAGGIAHDFNNLLTGILGNISLAGRYVDPDSRAHRRLFEAERASLRARDLTQQLLTFSKGGAPVKKAASLGDLIMESAGFALRGSKSKCEYRIPGEIWPVEVDEGQITQVVQNLVINADQAMPGGGRVVIDCENVVLRDGKVAGLGEGKYLKVSVRDEGTGISKENLKRIFDPFFTTKPRGSGLGLATAYSIIKNHEGYLGVLSTPGKGSAFYFYLPAFPGGRTGKDRTKTEISDGGKGRILLMDDEEIIRDVGGSMLESLGFEVALASDGEEAIELFRTAEEEQRPFGLLILDLTIAGGMGGREALERIREIVPGVRAVVSSGYSNDPVMSKYREYGFEGVITKPYNVRMLGEVVAAAMNGGNGTDNRGVSS